MENGDAKDEGEIKC